MDLHIGVLALQGGFAKHAAMLNKMGVSTRFIKNPSTLKQCAGLIIPGGESTTLSLLMSRYGFYPAVRAFARENPVMGTCAGAILLGKNAGDPRVRELKLMDITSQRNAYGRQTESFVASIDTPFTSNRTPLRAIFIRAPQLQVESGNVRILAEFEQMPVIVQQRNMLALTFHPELSDDPRIHRYFMNKMVQANH